MSAEDKSMFLEELHLTQSGLDRIITEGYSLLGLISYLTAGVQEVRAWTITKGTKEMCIRDRYNFFVFALEIFKEAAGSFYEAWFLIGLLPTRFSSDFRFSHC